MNIAVRKCHLVMLLLSVANFSFGQSDTTGFLKKGKHKVFITLTGSERNKKLKGYPIAINDSGILITSTFSPRKYSHGELRYQLIFIKATDIERMHFRRRGSIGWGIVAGGVAGVVVGVAIASDNTEPDDGWAGSLERLGGGIFGLESGAIVGGIIGAQFRKRFKIGGNLQKFLKIKKQIGVYLPRDLQAVR